MSKISVIMPLYNAEDFFSESLESVLKQSFTDIEVIIVKNGSAESYITNAGNDQRIHWIDNMMRDHTQFLNLAINASTGKYIAFIDGHAIMHVDRLKLQYSLMEEFPEIALCSSWETLYGKIIPKRVEEHNVFGMVELPLVQLLLYDTVINSNFTVRKSFISNNIFFDDYKRINDASFRDSVSNIHFSDLAWDYKFWVTVAMQKGCFYIDSQPLNYRRINEISISAKQRLDKLKVISNIKKEMIAILCQKLNETHPALTNLYHSYYELLEQQLISEDDIYRQLYALFMKIKEVTQNSPK